MIIVISHMDGYYKYDETHRDNPESNALSAIVNGVDLMLDASNHESLAGLVFADLFRGSHLIDTEIDKLPGYVMGGVNMDYFNQIVINCDDINDDYNYYLHRTSNFEEDEATKKKYDGLVTKYLSDDTFNMDYTEVQLSLSFNLKTFRNLQEKVFMKLMFDAVREKMGKIDLLIMPAGTVRSTAKYVQGTAFTSYKLLMIFAFGLNMTAFEADKKKLSSFHDEFGSGTGKGSYPQYYPKNHLSALKDDETIICATTSYHFKGGDGYPFKDNKVVTENDILRYMNNEKKLVHFGK